MRDVVFLSTSTDFNGLAIFCKAAKMRTSRFLGVRKENVNDFRRRAYGDFASANLICRVCGNQRFFAHAQPIILADFRFHTRYARNPGQHRKVAGASSLHSLHTVDHGRSLTFCQSPKKVQATAGRSTRTFFKRKWTWASLCSAPKDHLSLSSR